MMNSIKRQKEMRTRRSRAGFTMAEMLIVVAIIGVLSAVSFISVQTHQKNMNRLELDTVAKQIFVAAQNHLFMAQTENYLGIGSDGYGTPVDATNSDGIYYFAVKKGSTLPLNNTLFDQMLPFGSIDETVRGNGSYIIFYQPDTAMVLDVFYSDKACDMDATYRINLSGDGKKTARRDHDPMLGWYGEEAAGRTGKDAENNDIKRGTPLEQPTIQVVNAEKLLVKVTDPNLGVREQGYNLILIITGINLNGEESVAKKAIKLVDGNINLYENVNSSEDGSTPKYASYDIILDDITTAGMHFANLGTDNGVNFMPGQNISIQAVAYHNQKITNIASSDVETTNSLFEELSPDKT